MVFYESPYRVVKSRQPMTEADAERLRRWLEVRTKIAQVKLYTE